MDIHLVGGFLGSGKTTAIIGAAKLLVAQGLKVGVATNDQGRYLVDSAFVAAEGLPYVEVTGGCFCCNYDDFARVIATLARRDRPDVVFAESVGSCADLVATVVKPLAAAAAAARAEGRLRSLSVFADARFLDRWLDGLSLPFSESVTYIFGKQLEEAGVLVANKADLVSPQQRARILERAQRRFAGKTVRMQSSRTAEDLAGWLAAIRDGSPEASRDGSPEASRDGSPAAIRDGSPQANRNGSPQALPAASLDIDYQRYGSGEAELAWLDARVTVRCPEGRGGTAVEAIFAAIRDGLRERGAPVGHVKALVEHQGGAAKVSLTGADEEGPRLGPVAGTRLSLLLNARAQMPAEDLRTVVHAALVGASAAHGCAVEVVEESAFHPGWPRPTHRIA